MMDGKKLPLKSAIWQIVAAFIAHSTVIQSGINLTYSTILLPQIMGKHIDNFNNVTNSNTTNATEFTNELVVDKDEASWIASLVAIATAFGSLMTGVLMDRFGRKTICAFTLVPYITSWILVVLTTFSVYTLYAARILAGVGAALSTTALVYVSEISHPSIRPMLLSLTTVFFSFGILLTSLLSYFLTWKIVAVCCGAIAFVNLICVLFIPESPSWIVGVSLNDDEKGGELKRAEKSLKWLYTNTEDYRQEFESLVKIKEQKSAERKDTLFKSESPTSKTTLKSPEAWKPFLFLFVLFTLQQFSGAYVVIFYAVQIFEASGSVEIDQFTSVVILSVVRFVMGIISMFLSKTIGRRPLLISSGIGMVVTSLVAAGWIQFQSKGLIPVIFILLYVLFASYGMTVIPWSLIGELLPLSVRGKGSGALVAVAYIHMFVTVKLFLLVLDYIGIELMLVVFSVFSFAVVVLVYFELPETLGKTFQEIENRYRKRIQ